MREGIYMDISTRLHFATCQKQPQKQTLSYFAGDKIRNFVWSVSVMRFFKFNFQKGKKNHLVVFHRLLIDWGSFCKIPYRMLNEVCTCVTFNVKFGRGLNYTQLKKKVDGLRVFIVPASFTAKNPPNELRVYSSSYTCLWHSGKI